MAHDHPVELTAEQLINLAYPKPIICSARCDHGCRIQPAPGQDPWQAVLQGGWTLVLWRHPDSDHNQHAVFFCEPQCHYTWLLARMVMDEHFMAALPEMGVRAENMAEEMRHHRYQHGEEEC